MRTFIKHFIKSEEFWVLSIMDDYFLIIDLHNRLIIVYELSFSKGSASNGYFYSFALLFSEVSREALCKFSWFLNFGVASYCTFLGKADRRISETAAKERFAASRCICSS